MYGGCTIERSDYEHPCLRPVSRSIAEAITLLSTAIAYRMNEQGERWPRTLGRRLCSAAISRRLTLSLLDSFWSNIGFAESMQLRARCLDYAHGILLLSLVEAACKVSNLSE